MIESKRKIKEDYSFLLTAEEVLEAEAYEEMLLDNGISVIKERYTHQGTPKGQYSTELSEQFSTGMNLFVPKDNMDKARHLLYLFENEPIEYDTSYAAYNHRMKPNRLKYGLAVLFLFVLPVLLAGYSLVSKILNRF